MSHGENSGPIVFHSPPVDIMNNVFLCLVNPENPGNVGSICRVMENMGVTNSLLYVGNPALLEASDAERMAKHAKPKLKSARCFSGLAEALASVPKPSLSLATSARVGSSHRPHPIWVREAAERACQHLKQGTRASLIWVFGCESDGLSNEDLGLCDWVVNIPSSNTYRSINLAQAAMIISYECYLQSLENPQIEMREQSQKHRLIQHMLHWAEKVGFILPGDPAKMRPRLSKILEGLPNHIEDVRTLHGLIDQTLRSLDKGYADVRGRYRHMEESYGRKRQDPGN